MHTLSINIKCLREKTGPLSLASLSSHASALRRPDRPCTGSGQRVEHVAAESSAGAVSGQGPVRIRSLGRPCLSFAQGQNTQAPDSEETLRGGDLVQLVEAGCWPKGLCRVRTGDMPLRRSTLRYSCTCCQECTTA